MHAAYTELTDGFIRKTGNARRLEAAMVIFKGLLAAALAALGVFAVYSGDTGSGADAAQFSHPYPNAGLPGLLRPMEH